MLLQPRQPLHTRQEPSEPRASTPFSVLPTSTQLSVHSTPTRAPGKDRSKPECLRNAPQKSSTLSPTLGQSARTKRPTGSVSPLLLPLASFANQLTTRTDSQAIKKFDAEPLLRQDIQWQVLDHIFADRSFRFTAPVDSASFPFLFPHLTEREPVTDDDSTAMLHRNHPRRLRSTSTLTSSFSKRSSRASRRPRMSAANSSPTPSLP